MTVKALYRLVAAAALLLVTACGFHLAGRESLIEPLRVVRIDVIAPYRVSEPPVEIALRAQLQRRGADVVERADPNVTLIRLTDLEEDREVLSVGVDGKALEYLLTTSVSYQVSRAGEVLLQADEIVVTRDYSFDAEEVLAKEAEEQRLREFMQNELAQLLLFRIETRLGNRPVTPVNPVPAPAG